MSANVTTKHEFETAMVPYRKSYIESLWELRKAMQKKAITNKPPLNPSIHFSECRLNAEDCPCVCSVSLQPPFISLR